MKAQHSECRFRLTSGAKRGPARGPVSDIESLTDRGDLITEVASWTRGLERDLFYAADGRLPSDPDTLRNYARIAARAALFAAVAAEHGEVA
jgi:hypothetical protein